MATVKLTNIKKSFGDVDIIKGVSLGIEDREFCVFVGPSGCGKSTLLRLIAGLEEITGGDLFIDGVRSNDVPPPKRGLAMVFQSYALYPHMSVADNMGFSLKLGHVPKEERDKKVNDAARVLQLEPLLHRKPKELSGGQRQRVAIGRAIVRNPKVFLFDEPLSNLDAALRVQMRIELTRLHDVLKATMIYVTHDQVEAMTMANKIVVAAGVVPPPEQQVRGGLHRIAEDELPERNRDRIDGRHGLGAPRWRGDDRCAGRGQSPQRGHGGHPGHPPGALQGGGRWWPAPG